MQGIKTIVVCANCESRLTKDEQLNSNGICPRCGHRETPNMGVVATKEVNYYGR